MSDAAVSPEVAARRRRWRLAILGSTWWAYAGLYFSRKAFYAVKDVLGDHLGFDEVSLGYIGAIYLIAYTAGQFISASVGQRLGARRLLLTGMGLSVVANIVFATASGWWTFAVFMAVNGLAQATGWSTCMGIIGHWTSRGERGTIMGFWATCYQLGGVMATSWAGLWLGIAWGSGGPASWRVAFLAGAAVTAVCWLGVFLFARNKPEDVGLEPVQDEHAAGVADDSDIDTATSSSKGFRWTPALITTVVLVGLTYMGIKFVRYTVWSWSAYFLRDYYHLADDVSAYYSTVFDWGGFVGVVVAGYLSDKLFNSRRAGLSFLMLTGMTLGCVVLYAKGTDSVAWFVGSMVVVGFMLYGPDSLLSGAGAIDLGSRRAAIAAAGIINGMGSAGSVIQELFVASIYKESHGQVGPVFAMLIGASALAMGALGVVLWRNRRGLSDL